MTITQPLLASRCSGSCLLVPSGLLGKHFHFSHLGPPAAKTRAPCSDRWPDAHPAPLPVPGMMAARHLPSLPPLLFCTPAGGSGPLC